MKRILTFLMLLFSGTALVNGGIYSIAKTNSKQAGVNYTENFEQAASPLKRYDEGLTRYYLDNHQYSNKYESNHFIIYYDNKVSQSTVIDCANTFETVRQKYLSLGFKEPLLETNYSKFRVGVNYDSLSPIAWCHTNSGSKPTSCNITLSCVQSIGQSQKDGIAHEYFHAVQNAYSIQDLSWFGESSADWGMFACWRTDCISSNWAINSCINGGFNLFNQNQDRNALMFALTFTKECGDSAMSELFRELENMNSNVNTQNFINAINNVASKHSSSYEELLNKMHTYEVDPYYWYSRYFESGKINISEHRNKDDEITINSYSTNISYSDTIEASSAKYIVLKPSSGYFGTINYEIEFEDFGNGCVFSEYYKAYSNEQYACYNPISYYASGSFESYQVAGGEVGLILTNPYYYAEISFTINCSLKSGTIVNTFTNSTKVIEKNVFVPAGGYAECQVRFASAGSKIVQTMGTLDTKLSIYRSNTLINDPSECDDYGYSINAWYSFSAQGSTTYKIRVSLYNTELAGYVKLLVLSTEGFSKNGNNPIPNFNDVFYVGYEDYFQVNAWIMQNETSIITYRPQTSGIHTISLESVFDNFLYIFDPTSNELGQSGVDFDDDSGSGYNAQITRYFSSGRTYLFVFSQYNPGNTISNTNEGDDIYIHISK